MSGWHVQNSPKLPWSRSTIIPPPSFTTQPPPPQMPKTSECLRSSLWQVNFAYVDKWGAKSDWQTCLLVYVRKYPLRFKWFEVKLSSSRCYGASWKLLVSPGAQKELKYWSSDWKYRLEWKYFWFLVNGILVLTGLHVSLRKKSI